MCNDDIENGTAPDVKEEPMETEGEEIKDGDDSSEQRSVNDNSDDVPSGSSCHVTMETDGSDSKPSIESSAGPSSSSVLVDDDARASSSKSIGEGKVLL